MFRQGLPRALMIGMWVGYFIFGLALNYNLATHNYYQLQLIPIIGLSIGPVIALVMDHLNQIHPQIHWRFASWGVLLLALLLSIGIARSRLVNPNLEHTVKVEQEIGELVNHSTRTIYLSSDYGVSLEYNGLLSGSPWPLASDLEWEQLAGVTTLTAEERYNAWFAKNSPEYFIVEDFVEFDKQPDLKQFLSRFPIVSQNNDYVIYSLKGS